MLERFTPEARAAVVEAQHAALALHHNYIGTEHLLLGVLPDRETVVGRTLAAFGVTADTVRRHVVDVVGCGPDPGTAEVDALAAIGIDLAAVRTRVEERFGPGALERDSRWLAFQPRAKRALQLGAEEAGEREVKPEHILLGGWSLFAQRASTPRGCRRGRDGLGCAWARVTDVAKRRRQEL